MNLMASPWTFFSQCGNGKVSAYLVRDLRRRRANWTVSTNWKVSCGRLQHTCCFLIADWITTRRRGSTTCSSQMRPTIATTESSSARSRPPARGWICMCRSTPLLCSRRPGSRSFHRAPWSPSPRARGRSWFAAALGGRRIRRSNGTEKVREKKNSILIS